MTKKPAVALHLDPYDGAYREVIKIIERCYEGHSHHELVNGLLDFVEYQLDRIPSLWNQIGEYTRLNGSAPSQQDVSRFPEPSELSDRWKRIKEWKADTLGLFAQAFGIILAATQNADGSYTYADVLGEVYEEYVYHGDAKWKGQFFTPQHICYLMAQLVQAIQENEALERLDRAIAHSRFYQVFQLMGADMTLERKLLTLKDPDAMAHLDPITVCDPACGSGRMLLGYARCAPRWAIEHGIVAFYGVDIDQRCVQMTRLNVRLYGLNNTGYGFDTVVPGIDITEEFSQMLRIRQGNIPDGLPAEVTLVDVDVPLPRSSTKSRKVALTGRFTQGTLPI